MSKTHGPIKIRLLTRMNPGAISLQSLLPTFQHSTKPLPIPVVPVTAGQTPIDLCVSWVQLDL